MYMFIHKQMIKVYKITRGEKKKPEDFWEAGHVLFDSGSGYMNSTL